MFQNSYFVNKSKGTFADTLTAFGVAYLLRNILFENHIESSIVTIKDQGSYFEIFLSEPIQPGYEENISWFELLPFVETAKKKPPEDWNGQVFDYEAKRQARAAYFVALKQLSPEVKRHLQNIREFLPAEPDTHLEYFEMVNQMQSLTAYIQVWEMWRATRKCFPEILRIILTLFSSPENNLDGIARLRRDVWKQIKQHTSLKEDCITPVQAINPAMGKGINREKMDGARNLANPDSFWLLELLKFFGAFKAALPRVVKSTQKNGPRDRKTYVIQPKNLSLKTHEATFNDFKKSLWSTTAVQLDILAGLTYTTRFLEQWSGGQNVDDSMEGQQPGNYVSSLAVAFYKDLGSAVALLNLSEIALPAWMPRLNSLQDVSKYREMLEEHRRVIWCLTEKKSSEFDLLKTYRNFFSGHDLTAFLQFTAGYSSLLMSKISRNEPGKQFSIANLEALIMAHDKKLLPIVQNVGFLNVAKAIRHSTVISQRRKADRDQAYPYKPHYGLGTALVRNATYPEKFILALSEFVTEYNQEILRVNERFEGKIPKLYRRSSIKEADLQQVIELMDEYGSSELIARLLIAFGYAGTGQKNQSKGDEPQEAQDVQNEYDLNIQDDETELE